MENLTKATIEKIEELVLRGEAPKIIEINGKKYAQRSLYEVEPKKYLSNMNTTSLISFVDFAKKVILESGGLKGFVIQIKDHTGVVLYEPVDEEKRRNPIITAISEDVCYSFMDKYISTEDMIINLRRTAEESVGDYESLIKIVSGVSNKQEVQVTDDGIGQKTTLVQGSTVIGQAEIKGIVSLNLRRTFLDLPSIEEKFVVRIKDGKVALFSANSCYFKKAYFEAIRLMLTKALKEEIESGALLII